jgi:hypothetical protein
LGVKGGKRFKSLTCKSSSQAFYLLPQNIDFLIRLNVFGMIEKRRKKISYFQCPNEFHISIFFLNYPYALTRTFESDTFKNKEVVE